MADCPPTLASPHEHISENPKIAFEIDVYELGDDGVFDFRGMMSKAKPIKS